MTYLPNSEKQIGTQHKNLYNKQLNLNDRKVTALVTEYKEDTRDIIFFVYEGLLVLVRCNPEVWTEDWFDGLSFDIIIKQYPPTNFKLTNKTPPNRPLKNLLGGCDHYIYYSEMLCESSSCGSSLGFRSGSIMYFSITG